MVDIGTRWAEATYDPFVLAGKEMQQLELQETD